ncbi:hypothetical protein Q4Q81_16395, partial [Morganella morganii]
QKKIYKLSDIPDINLNKDSLRRNFDMAVIDDHEFVSAKHLERSGFSIDEIGDIDNLKKIEAYPIVICDIQGVGKAFGAEVEGAYVVSEIRKKYPDKYIIAYSTRSFEFSYQSYISKADVAMPKVSSIEEWTEILDSAIEVVSNPKNRWIRIRKRLLDSNVELYDVFNLEQSYIMSVLNKNENILKDSVDSVELDSTTKEIIKIFAATALTAIIKGIVSNG